MIGRFSFPALCLATASAMFGQNIWPASPETPEPRTLARTEGRKILATIPRVDIESESETDCSHLVHDVYEQAGFPYDYVTSRELYIGSTNFTRVRVPQAGDLVVWRGHVGIVIDPKQHSFFSFVRSGPDTQFYDSPYWRLRGNARFFRYVTRTPLHAGRTLEDAGHHHLFRAATAVRRTTCLPSWPTRHQRVRRILFLQLTPPVQLRQKHPTKSFFKWQGKALRQKKS